MSQLHLKLPEVGGEPVVDKGEGVVGGEDEASFKVNYRAMPQVYIWHSKEEGKSR